MWPPQLDAVIAATTNHRVLMEDEAVRVLEVIVDPGERENLHHHRWPSIMRLPPQVTHAIEVDADAPHRFRGSGSSSKPSASLSVWRLMEKLGHHAADRSAAHEPQRHPPPDRRRGLSRAARRANPTRQEQPTLIAVRTNPTDRARAAARGKSDSPEDLPLPRAGDHRSAPTWSGGQQAKRARAKEPRGRAYEPHDELSPPNSITFSPCSLSRGSRCRGVETGQVIAKGRRIGVGGGGRPTMMASCAVRASISAAKSKQTGRRAWRRWLRLSGPHLA